MRTTQLPSGIWLGAALLLTGCGDTFQISEVEGKLLVDGKPVEKIQVEFVPKGEGPHSIGITDASGKFTLSTLDGKRKGAVVGTSKVVLRDVGIMGDKFLGREGENVDMTQGRKPRVADDYADAVKTPLEKQVTAGKCVIDLEAKAPPADANAPAS
jgi:hypothetical protein